MENKKAVDPLERDFIIGHLERKSNAILSFIVLQSLLLADRLTNEEFVQKIRMLKGLEWVMFFIHSGLLITAAILLIAIEQRVEKQLNGNLKKIFQPRTTLTVKLIVTILFGAFPIIVFAFHFLN